MKNPAHEMIGYQADLGPGYWGALYDESRRNKVLASPDSNLVKRFLKINDWNDYEITAVKNRIRIKINNTTTVNYLELDSTIAQAGFIGLQVHGGGKTRIGYKNITISKISPSWSGFRPPSACAIWPNAPRGAAGTPQFP